MPLVEQTRAAVVAVKTVAILTNAAENHRPISIFGKHWVGADADSLTVTQPTSAVWVESSSASTFTPASFSDAEACLQNRSNFYTS